MQIIIGTNNSGKLREYGVLLAGMSVELLSPHEAGLADFDVDETGDSFQQNAELKARAYARAGGQFALADDSGLCVDALDGAPGVYSARYGAAGLDDAGRRRKLLADLAGVPDEDRTARFECVIALAEPHTGRCIVAQGICPGRIARVDSDGPQGFGYDAVFIPDGHERTFAELPAEEKNRISHRGAAVRHLLPILREIIRTEG
jgi:XTP/dITP diphosphohydrolase